MWLPCSTWDLEKTLPIGYTSYVSNRCSVSSNRPAPLIRGTSAKRCSLWVGSAPGAWLPRLELKPRELFTWFAGYQVSATSRCARWDGAETLRVPAARGGSQRVRRRTEECSPQTRLSLETVSHKFLRIVAARSLRPSALPSLAQPYRR